MAALSGVIQRPILRTHVPSDKGRSMRSPNCVEADGLHHLHRRNEGLKSWILTID